MFLFILQNSQHVFPWKDCSRSIEFWHQWVIIDIKICINIHFIWTFLQLLTIFHRRTWKMCKFQLTFYNSLWRFDIVTDNLNRNYAILWTGFKQFWISWLLGKLKKFLLQFECWLSISEIDKFLGAFSIIYVFTSFGANDKNHQKSITIKNAEHTQTCFVLIAKLPELGVQQVAWGKEENAFENMLFRKADTRNEIWFGPVSHSFFSEMKCGKIRLG